MNLPQLVTISYGITRSMSPSRCSSPSSSSSSTSSMDRPCSSSPACCGGSTAATAAVRRRRSGRSWSLDSEYSDVGDLVEVSCHDSSTTRASRSCMKVATLEDSLRSCGAESVDERLRRNSDDGGGDINKSLRFGSLRIRECDVVVLSDNNNSKPGSSKKKKGPKIGLSWSHQDLPCQEVDEYERSRMKRYAERKMASPLVNAAERHAKLRRSGGGTARRRILEKRIGGADEMLETAMKNVRVALRIQKRRGDLEQSLWDEAQNVRAKAA